jgi:hypothetical protein
MAAARHFSGLTFVAWSTPMDTTRYPDYLSRTELFQSYGPPRTNTKGRVLLAAITAPLRGPLQLVWLPAVVALVSWPALNTIGAAILSIAALVIAGNDDRFDAMWRLLQMGLFRGGALAVSLAVVAFAAARLAGVSHVTTILDSAAGAVILFLLAGFICSPGGPSIGSAACSPSRFCSSSRAPWHQRGSLHDCPLGTTLRPGFE